MEGFNENQRKSIEFSLKSKIALGSINKRRNTEYCFLRPKQIECVKNALNSDTIVILPTGYGKSLIYEIVQCISTQKIIIISPINAIIEEQVTKFGNSAVEVDSKLVKKIANMGRDDVSVFQQSDVRFLKGHPECFLDKSVCDVLTTCSDIGHIFVDEAHCVVSWGSEFRPAFDKISKLRSIFPKSYMIGMTATATLKMQKEIKEKLQMKSTQIVAQNPNRPNVKITVAKRPATVGGKTPVDDSIQDLLMPYVHQLFDKQLEFEKTIIYSNLKTCGLAYDIVKRQSLKRFNDDSMMQFVSQYHAPSTEEKKKKITIEMKRHTGCLRLLFATEAYGMGTDAPDIRRVIHIGPPNSLETYVQEIGRAGRDGKLSTATLYFNASDLGENRRNLTSEIRSFCKTDSCRRQHVIKHFGFEINMDYITNNHECCDICERTCDCQECLVKIVDLLDVKEAKEVHSITDSNETKEVLSTSLQAYFDFENKQSGGVFHTGLSQSCLQNVVKKHSQFKNEAEFHAHFSGINCSFVKNIIHIITCVKARESPSQ